MLKYKSILVTGGTGFFARHFVETIIKEFQEIEQVIIFSRDEYKQLLLARDLHEISGGKVKFKLGDVRSKDDLWRSAIGVDCIVHAAALKQVPAAESNPIEFVKTNILGTQNVIDVALAHQVKKVIFLSTDKAASPYGLYGATKLCAEKLVTAAHEANSGTSLTIIRLANLMGSRGSVIPFFLNERKKGRLPITHPEMTRFSISVKQSIELAVFAMTRGLGGEILVPKTQSYSIMDLADAIDPDCEKEVIGVRPGDKIHEELISQEDSLNTYEAKSFYLILPNDISKGSETIEKYKEFYSAHPVPNNFTYCSNMENNLLGVEQIRELIRVNSDQFGE